MGVVWLAVDTLIERRVALKELRAAPGVGGSDEASFVERALREARNAGRLNHPGIVAVHDVIAPTGDDGSVYIVMEYVEAPTLDDLVEQQGALPAPRVAAMGAGILDALMAAHAMGIVHRDIKPSNVLVRDGDRVKLTDFGIALAAEDTRLTRSGVMGTQAYIAPEAFDSGQVGPAADLWALGATLFRAVAGRAPFERDTATATLRAILFEEPPAPPCPPSLGEVITGLLTRPVDQRLGGDDARRKLERAATEPAAPPPAPGASTTGGTGGTPGTGGSGPGGWQAQATNLHRPPPRAFATTQPEPPASFLGPPTTPGHPGPGGPGGPGSFAHPVTGPGLSPGEAPPSGSVPGGPWASPPARRNNTPLVIGGAIAAAAVLLVVVLVAGGGGSDSDDGGGPGASVTAPSELPAPGATTGSDPADPADPATDPAGDAAGGQAAAQAFLDAVNSGDEDTASGMLCPLNKDTTEPATSTAIAGQASLEIDESETESDASGFWTRLAGTVDGQPTDLAFMTTSNDGDGAFCVMQFDLGRS
jgi:hypothetical protein